MLGYNEVSATFPGLHHPKLRAPGFAIGVWGANQDMITKMCPLKPKLDIHFVMIPKIFSVISGHFIYKPYL